MKRNDHNGDTPIFHWTMIKGGRITEQKHQGFSVAVLGDSLWSSCSPHFGMISYDLWIFSLEVCIILIFVDHNVSIFVWSFIWIFSVEDSISFFDPLCWTFATFFSVERYPLWSKETTPAALSLCSSVFWGSGIAQMTCIYRKLTRQSLENHHFQ